MKQKSHLASKMTFIMDSLRTKKQYLIHISNLNI